MAKKKSKTKDGGTPKRTPPKPPPTPDEAEPEVGTGPGLGLPVVGIGASAGGLDAFKRFFGAMPTDSGVAFVLIPHLDPKHESLMVELLSRHTKMPVVEAAHGMAVQADHVYILPPNKYMTILGGVLQLTGPVERGSWQTSIDLFMRSLASDRQERAICIILSGTGAHGTLGLKAVKAAGGMAMVQDPSSAEQPRMPQSAIATGLADYVLPPEKMPAALVGYMQHFYRNGGAAGAKVGAAPDHLNQVLALLRIRGKFDFRCYRKKMLARRIERRMGLNHFENLADYVAHLHAHPDEIKHLTRDLLISVTSFFRDAEALEALAKEVIAPLVRGAGVDATLRLWVPGCATGEEPYTIAILVLEELAKAQKLCRVQVFATDVDEDALNVARQGIYPESIRADISPERLSRYFVRLDEVGYQISKQVRETVIFAVQNLIADAPFSKIDFISCRNVLIYLESEVQQKIITLLHFALNEGGHLLLGPSETIGRQTDMFEPISKKWRIFKRIGPSRPERVELPIMAGLETRGPPRRTVEPGAPHRPVSFADMTQRLVVEELAPAAVLINRKYEVLYFLGPTTRYLDMPTGEPTKDLLALAREGLRSRLRGAIHKAISDNASIRLEDLRVRRNGDYARIAVTVKPVGAPDGPDGLVLVLFQDLEEPTPRRADRDQDADGSLLKQLEYELHATKEDLQSTVEEMETSNDDLKASNEEVMSMNEELQSANEELETSKEELQSLNEEMNTVNNQLQEKVDQLEDSNNDMANLLNCTDIALVFLDTGFRIRRFTPAASQLLSVIGTDVGRPFGDITPKFADPELMADVQEVLRRLSPREKEVRSADGRWWLRRCVPYRTADNHIEGVVLTFGDISQIRRGTEQAKLFATVMANSSDAVLVHDFDGMLTHWNRGAEKLYGYTEAEARHMKVRKLMTDQAWAAYRDLLDRLKQGERIESFEAQRLAKDGHAIDVWITLTVVTDEAGRPIAVAKTDRDITERKRMQASLEQEVAHRTAALLEKESRLRAVLNAPHDAIITFDRQQAIQSVNPAAERMFGYPAAEMAGKKLHALMPALNNLPDDLSRHSTQGGALSHEIEARRKDGSTFYVDFAVSAVEKLPLFTGILRDITRRKELEREVVEIAALEQQRIGQDLHDQCGQQLTALGLYADTLMNSLRDRSPGDVELVRKITLSAKVLLRQVRGIAKGLALTLVDADGLPDALTELAARMSEMADIHCVFHGAPRVHAADELRSTHLYHIAQEACTNVVKHAAAKNIEIRLDSKDNALVLQIRDDGSGVAADANPGLGMSIMRNRADVIGATLSVEPAKPHGTLVTCTLFPEGPHGKHSH